MSPTFIYTPRGYINLAKVERAAFNKDGSYRIEVDGEVVDDSNRNFGEVLTRLIPCTEPTECLTVCEGDDEHPEDEILVEPVIAWGQSATGHVVPVTPSSMDGEYGAYGLRKVGTSRVYCDSNIGGWASAEEWLASVLQRKPKLKAA